MNEILYTFYKEIIPEIKRNKYIDNNLTSYFLDININIENKEIINTEGFKPLLNIHNKIIFDNLLVEYITKFKNHISNFNLNEFTSIKSLFPSIFYNMSNNDFLEPEAYLRKRIDFIDNNQLNTSNEIKELYSNSEDNKIVGNISDINSYITYQSIPQNPNLETPYVFIPSFTSELDPTDIYYLPRISYGISGDTAYIYAIQNKNKIIYNKYENIIKRYLYKANKGINEDNELINVSPGALVSLSIFIKILKCNNINKIEVVDYLPIRMNAKEENYQKSINTFKIFYSESDIIKKIKTNNEELNRINYDVINKYITNFYRLEYHLDNIHIINHPDNTNLKINILDNELDNNHLLKKIYNNTSLERGKHL